VPEQAATATPSRAADYRGRFAPSPTGPLHMGSVLAALASFLDARHHKGQWLLRMEDLDPPREVAGAADGILRTLERLGLHWDESVCFQSKRLPAYAEALQHLLASDLLYCCRCSRTALADQQTYPGTCRARQYAIDGPGALRCRVPSVRLGITDRLQGLFEQHLGVDVGDFVVRRKDGLFAYQLAVVVDDGWQNISDVVRGSDLLDSTPRQRFLQQCLGLPALRYAHIPLLVDAAGQKLGKQQLAAAVDALPPHTVLGRALTYLQQSPPAELLAAPVQQQLDWAIAHWQPARLAGRRELRE
jgi:glutamyl-Q tRNA(Asp) synthetase